MATGTLTRDALAGKVGVVAGRAAESTVGSPQMEHLQVLGQLLD
jgi:hypothetical protein